MSQTPKVDMVFFIKMTFNLLQIMNYKVFVIIVFKHL